MVPFEQGELANQ